MKQLLFAYFLGNICAKNCQNPFMYVIVIVCNIKVVFRHSILYFSVICAFFNLMV